MIKSDRLRMKNKFFFSKIRRGHEKYVKSIPQLDLEWKYKLY